MSTAAVLGLLALFLQAVSLAGVWVEIFSPQSRSGKPPMARTVLILAIMSGCSYYVAGFAEPTIDWVKVAYGAASVITCGTNLSQWYVRPSYRRITIVVMIELFLLGSLAALARRHPLQAQAIVGVLPIWFMASQSAGRVVQIIRFSKVPPDGASLLLWGANVSLNACMVLYHTATSEGLWVIANIVSGFFGVIIVLQILSNRLKRKEKTTTITTTVVTATALRPVETYPNN